MNDPADAKGTFRTLSISEIKEDFACLRMLFEKQYAAARSYKEKGTDLTKMLNDLEATLGPACEASVFGRFDVLENGRRYVHRDLIPILKADLQRKPGRPKNAPAVSEPVEA